MQAGAGHKAGPADGSSRAARRVLLVSNRLPVIGAAGHGSPRASSGGLVTGLREVARRWPVVWFGWDGVARQQGVVASESVQPWEDGHLVALSMTEPEVARFYRRYCNSTLWPVLHGRTDDPPPDEEDWQTYRAMNERYAEAVLRQLRPGDRVWVHDYHLFLVPGLVRDRRPDVPVGFFLHTAFPEPEVFRMIPQSGQLLEGMMGADTLGFHTAAYAESFLRTARAMGYTTRGEVVEADRPVQVKVHPMGIDFEAFTRLGSDPEVIEEAEDVRAGRGQVLLGVDRLDYTKGIPQRLLAFEALLEQHPRLRGHVTLMQVAVPSREEIPAYRELKDVVEKLVQRINGTFRQPDWMPVEYFYGSVDLTTLVALYRAADVMVVTPVRDGLNLVAKEFIATRADGDGVLVLSRFAGAASELDAALQINPNRVNDLARAFHRALIMPPPQRHRRMHALRRAVASNNVFDWAGNFLDSLPVASDVAVERPGYSRWRRMPILPTPAGWALTPTPVTS